MENPEDVMMELAVLEKSPETTAINQTLEDYLTYVAKSGNALFSWSRIKPLFKKKLELVIQDFHDSCPTEDLPKQPNVDIFKFDQMKQRIFEQLESYSGIPFTVQRLCELLVQPKRHYKRTDKFMRGLEKIMLVVSTIDPNPSSNGDTDTSQESDDSRTTLLASQESPTKRPRLSLLSEDPGPCDSADEALPIQAVTVEEVPSIDSSGTSKHNGIEDVNTAEAETGEDENMEIDTECTSSQARMIVSESPASSDKPEESEDGVESSAGVSDNMELEPEVSDGVSTSETADTEGGEEKEKESDPAGEESGDLHSSSEETPPVPEVPVPETNSEAEPVEAGPEVVSKEEEDREVAPAVNDSSLENVQSSEERTESDSLPKEDSGVADSSDEVSPAVVQTSDMTETVTCSSEDTEETSSPDQSLQQD